MRIKHAYNTLLNSEPQSSNHSSDYPEHHLQGTKTRLREKRSFMGNFSRDVQITIGDFFCNLQAEFENWEAGVNSQEKPKSLWEELADIGEEFVEFLEKELNINDPVDSDVEGNSASSGNDDPQDKMKKESSIEDSIDDIEATLAQLKKEMGLQKDARVAVYRSIGRSSFTQTEQRLMFGARSRLELQLNKTNL